MSRRAIATTCCIAFLSLSACGGQDRAAAPEAPAPTPVAEAPKPAPAAEAPKPAAAVSDRVEDPTFELTLKPSGPYAAGKVSSFAVSLKPRGVYHVNQDYPFSVSLTAPAGVTLPKAELAKADAAEFTDNGVRVDVPFTASAAGSHAITANVKFAVCTPETCVPDERTLALAVAVE